MISGSNIVTGSAISGSRFNAAAGPGAGPAADAEPEEPRTDLGVITVLPQEQHAVVTALTGGHASRPSPGGPQYYEAWLPVPRRPPMRVVVLQTLRPGTESAALAARELSTRFRPAVVLLVGIAGAVADWVRVGDVVISDQIIAYDARRETAGGPRVRGWVQTVRGELGHRLNEFDAHHRYTPHDPRFRVFRGPVGSGNAVVTDRDSHIRTWLRTVHENVLAVETEAAGAAQAFHEAAGDSTRYGWLTIRGISDLADATKPSAGDHHDLAARRAASVMLGLAPYLDFRP
ncbi:5'-methylthioadenosine/S-adenosylhomocysteine nucleosidase family protein [Catenuloplanes atrovinosus]|uniref:Adenosylhomocysteine nucleosidase n=1 Tax=Catenuloplanes atrovinosus TaxID=137266 RepID=A0AAE3YMV4_9ACTN|nr:5'-methylthioadenosine/S-adenosylhomocysteine nucleosidase [Catenuloplanes atrovinosus]MDR7276410.1 adenosylhomocysteine nucleosidase [Catenuloplanes atrovinosus]